MNRPLRIIVIIGGIAIIALGIILFFLSKKTNYEVEKGLNEMFASLADNIEVSEDSRYFGLIDKKDIKGQVILIFSPKKRFQLFNNIFHHDN